jgi:A/G-specific adenine glycosylase
MITEISEIEGRVPAALLTWYARHRRKLPWRVTAGVPDPYAVWLSEIMLQQTTVEAVKPYYRAFLARWPTVDSLAAAPVEAVMQAWAGLGYYARARNLHACAVAVAHRHGGFFPRSEAELLALPGIGPYTAAAIAAIAFGRRAVVIDGNVERVVARLFAIDDPLPAAKSRIRAAAECVTPAEQCGDFAQAMMDLGATICTPKRPACALCPLAEFCRARATAAPEAYPVKAPKPVRPSRSGAVFYIRRADGHVLVRTREARGLLGGMTEFPGTAWTGQNELSAEDLQPPLPVDLHFLPGRVDHVFTHFALSLRVHLGEALAGVTAPPGFRFVSPLALDAEALPSLMRKVVAHVRAFGEVGAFGEVSHPRTDRDRTAPASPRRHRKRRKRPGPTAPS